MRVPSPLPLLPLLAALVAAPHFAAAQTKPDDPLQSVLRRLDETAKNFHTAQADFEYDTVQTDPVPDTDKQKGTVYFEHSTARFRMAAHIKEHNGNPSKTVYSYADGQFQLYEGAANQLTRITKASQFESYMLLGFGASGKDLESKWLITDKGPEVLDGVKTEKLELVARDPNVRKTISKVTVWMDLTRGISLKQLFEEPGGEYRVSVYFNFKLNQPLSDAEFKLPVNAQTSYVNR